MTFDPRTHNSPTSPSATGFPLPSTNFTSIPGKMRPTEVSVRGSSGCAWAIFGDAVTIVERHAEEFLDGDFHGGIEWRAGGRNNTQLRCAECGESLELRVFEQLVKHSGNAQEDGEAFFFDRRLGGDGIEARSDVERGSADQCPEENNGEADGVRHRQNPVETIARRERANPGGNT